MRFAIWAVFMLMPLLISCTEQEDIALAREFHAVKEIRCIVQQGDIVATVKTVTQADEIRKIYEEIRIVREEPVSKHLFLKTIVLMKADGSCCRIAYEKREGKRSIRWGSKQYQVNGASMDLLDSYYQK